MVLMTPVGALQPMQLVGLINPVVPAPKQVDEIKTLKSALPKLNVKDGAATVVNRNNNEWLQKTSLDMESSCHCCQGQLASRGPAHRAQPSGLPSTGHTLLSKPPLTFT